MQQRRRPDSTRRVGGAHRAALLAALLLATTAGPAAFAQAPAPPECELLGGFGDVVFEGTASDPVSGIDSVILDANSQNLILDVDLGEPGDSIVPFTLTISDPSSPASGKVIAANGLELTCSINVDVPRAYPPVNTTGWGEAIALQKQGNELFAYLAAGEAGAHIYDVTDPAAPVFITTDVPDPGVCPQVPGFPEFYADAVTIVQGGDLPFDSPLFNTDIALYAAGICGLVAADITEPDETVMLFAFPTPSWDEAVDVFIDVENETGYVYVASFWGGLRIFGEVETGVNPLGFDQLGSFGAGDASFGPAIDLDVEAQRQDGKILVHVLTDIGLRTIDVSDPTTPVQIGSFEFPVGSEIGGEGMTIVGNRAFVALWRGGLLVLDISDRTNPVEIETIPTNLAFFSVTTNAAGTRLYAAEGLLGVRTFRINESGLTEYFPSDLDVANGSWAWSLTERDRVLYVPYGRLGDPETGGFQTFLFTEDLACGLGFEAAFLLPPLLWLRRRRRAARAT